MLLLFPSYLLHSGLAYRGAKDRVILSFNSLIRYRPTNTAAPGGAAVLNPD
jgi:hypothetical protein